MTDARLKMVATVQASVTPQSLQLKLVTPTNVTGFFVGVALTGVSLKGTGGGGGYSYSIVSGSGSLPPGLSLNLTTGAITGTPTTQGRYEFTAQVQDALSQVAFQRVLMLVQSGLFPVAVHPTAGARGRPYRYQVLFADATGSTAGITYSVVAGALPTGVTLSAAGLISGSISSVAGTYSFTVRGTKSGVTLDVGMSIVVNGNLPSGTMALGPSLLNMAVGIPVDDFVTISAATAIGIGALSWSISAGALPPGLSMNSKGRITGTPTGATTNAYVQPTFQVTDESGATRTFTPSAGAGLSVNSTLRAAVRGTFQTAGPDGTPLALDMWSGYFGGGTDTANIALDGTNTYPGLFTKTGSVYKQLRAIYGVNITVGPGVTWDTAGSPWWFAGTMDISNCAGSKMIANGVSSTGRVAPAAPASPYFGSPSKAGDGGLATASTSAPGGDASPLSNNNGYGSAGTGGLGSAGSMGGTAGPGGNGSIANGGFTNGWPIRTPFAQLSSWFGYFCGGQSGGGGGAGGGNGTLPGGNGGGAGGAGLVIQGYAYTIKTGAGTPASFFQALGGNGANGSASPGANRAAGAGGGGGGGGIVFIVCAFRDGPTIANLIDVSGGNAGLKGNTGSGIASNDGVGGPSGAAFTFVLSTQTSGLLADPVSNVGITGGIGKLAF